MGVEIADGAMWTWLNGPVRGGHNAGVKREADSAGQFVCDCAREWFYLGQVRTYHDTYEEALDVAIAWVTE